MKKYFKVVMEAYESSVIIKEVFQEDSKEARVDFLNENLEIPIGGIPKEYVEFITGEINGASGEHKTYDNRATVSIQTYEEALDALWEDFNRTRDSFQKLANDSIEGGETVEDPFTVGNFVTLRKDLLDGDWYGKEMFFSEMASSDGVYKITRIDDEGFIRVNGYNGGYNYTREMFEEGK